MSESELADLIAFHKSVLLLQGYLIEPSIQTLITKTVAALEELQRIQGSKPSTPISLPGETVGVHHD